MDQSNAGNAAWMWARRIIGFCVGAGLSFALVVAFMQSAHMVPRGFGWIFLFIACGTLTSRLFANPKASWAPASIRWWGLDSKLRLAVVAAVIWMVAAFLMQDKWDRDWSWILVPPGALLALYFAYGAVVKPQRTADTSASTPSPIPAPAPAVATPTALPQAPEDTLAARQGFPEFPAEDRHKAFEASFRDAVTQEPAPSVTPVVGAAAVYEASAPVAEKDYTVWWILGLGFVGFLGLVAYQQISGSQEKWEQKTRETTNSAALAPAVEAPKVPEAVEQRPATMVVAAPKANLRQSSSAKSKIIAVLSRGDGAEPSLASGDFVQVKLDDGRSGWISKSLLISRQEAGRLSALSPQNYIASRPNYLEDFYKNSTMKDGPTFLVILDAVAARSPKLDEYMRWLETSKQPSPPNADPAAAIWYGMESRAAASAGHHARSLAAARAAVAADVSDADNLAALGFAIVRSNDFSAMETLPLLLLQSPGSTNTWVIIGSWAAYRGRDDLASAALDIAFRRSQNPRTTRAFLEMLAGQTSNPIVALALRAAVQRNSTDQAQNG